MALNIVKEKIVEKIKDIFKSSDYFTFLSVLFIIKITENFDFYNYFIFLNNKHNENNSYFS